MTKEKQENGKRFPAVAGNKYWDVQVLRTEYGQPRKPIETLVHERQVLDSRARFALACIEKWGMVCAMPDGEDSSGRQKARPATVAEITDRACNCADAAFEEFQKRGWFIEVPSYQELIDAAKGQEDGND